MVRSSRTPLEEAFAARLTATTPSPAYQSHWSRDAAAGRPPVLADHSSAIKACGAEGRWEEALELLQEMREDGVRPNLITYTGGTCVVHGFRWSGVDESLCRCGMSSRVGLLTVELFDTEMINC